MKRRHAQQTTKLTASSASQAQLPTFLEHLYELRRRIFWVVAVILVASAAAYPFLDGILGALMAPLGGQQLYYLTPVGGFSFSIKICMYVGLMAAVPFIMYHIYRYLEPLMGQHLRRSTLFYAGLSTLLAAAGVLFAYFISLPNALHFLTGMDLNNIQAMLTVDSYLTFVMTYLLGAALLFQIPLFLRIINTMTPFKPGGLGKSQRYVIVASFLAAAIMSPTPDVLNQVLFALPMIVMYEIGVVLVWLQNRRRRARQPFVIQPAVVPQPVQPTTAVQRQVAAPARPMQPARPRPVDGFVVRRPASALAARPVLPRPVMATAPRMRMPVRTIDGFMAYKPAAHSS